MLVLEAGIDIDVSTLKLIGTRGFLIAIVGSVLPIGMGMAIAVAILGTGNIKAIIAAGATFGPTSLGIALNILRSGGVLNTPVGQLIISAAVIDDMIALIVLSQLESLAGTITVAGIVVPIVSALAFLFIGGFVALFWVPGIVERVVLRRADEQYHGKLELTVMFGLLLALMPATYYSKASYLMGAFVAGLSFCTSHELHHTFVCQFKRVMQWLMRIFFAASIGFQVPLRSFANGTVIWQGLVFALALLGKVVVGFMVPNFTKSRKFTGMHLRDCLVTGFSMAAEGEFAFVIAVFAVEEELITQDVYASVVLAVLLSTILPPFLLRFTIGYYKNKAEEDLKQLANNEMKLNHNLENLLGEIENERAVFLCIQTQSEARWGLLLQLMASLGQLGLDVIDHRSWHPRGIDTTLVNEVYCKDVLDIREAGTAQAMLDERIKEIREALEKTIAQPDSSRVKVQRWYPGVVEEIIENVQEKSKPELTLNIEERLLKEATVQLDKHQTSQTTATKEKTVDEILSDMQGDMQGDKQVLAQIPESPGRRGRRRRQKMRSTPVVGGGLFGETSDVMNVAVASNKDKEEESSSKTKNDWKPNFGVRGHQAEIIVQGESYQIRINDSTLKALRTGFSGDMLDLGRSGAMSIHRDNSNVVSQLQGFVRNSTILTKITEENILDSESDTSSVVPSTKHEGPVKRPATPDSMV